MINFKVIMIAAVPITIPLVSSATDQQKAAHACASKPCPNTPGGADIETLEIKKGAKIIQSVRESSDDKRRWSVITLFSDSDSPDRLNIPLIKNEKSNVKLDPRKGLLTFTSPGLAQTFRIASPRGYKETACPDYQIRVEQAGTGYAVIKKICTEYEYKPGRVHQGTDYYLYDAQSATMRTIWSASTLSANAPFPEPNPKVEVKRSNAGYRFDWEGTFPTDSGSVKSAFHNEYVLEKPDGGILSLVCYDHSNPKRRVREGDMCEGGALELLP